MLSVKDRKSPQFDHERPVWLWITLFFVISVAFFIIVSGSEDIQAGDRQFRSALIASSYYLEAADIFVFPTEKEVFGISVIEAMACGLAVVATRTGGVIDISAEDQDSLLINPGNYESLKHAIETLLVDREIADKLGLRQLRKHEKNIQKSMLWNYMLCS